MRGLDERLEGLRVPGAQRDLRHVHVAVAHGHEPESLLRGWRQENEDCELVAVV